MWRAGSASWSTTGRRSSRSSSTRKKSGDEIVGQLYNFADKGGREVALRPEMTPTLARMVAARANALRKPVRWFSMPQLFRYERQQKGRLREHFQLNVDIFGEADVAADAELLAVRARRHARAAVSTSSDVVARVSDRRLLSATCESLGVPDDVGARRVRVIDKIEREPRRSSRREARGARRAGAAAMEPIARAIADVGFDELRVASRATARRRRPLERLRRLPALRARRARRRRDVAASRSLDRARAGVLHGHRVRAVRRARASSARSAAVAGTTRSCRRSAASTCRRSDSGWAMSCWASCCGPRADAVDVAEPTSGLPLRTRRSCDGVRVPRSFARRRSVEYALRDQADHGS